MIPENIERWSKTDWNNNVYYCAPSGGAVGGSQKLLESFNCRFRHQTDSRNRRPDQVYRTNS